MAKISLVEALSRPSTVDRAKLEATTEADIQRHMIEDGFDPDEEIPAHDWRVVRPPREVRARFGLTQVRFAALIGVPVATYREWEQGRTALPTGIRALFDILDREPEAARRALESRATAA
jgi:putative transcriptional regulator